MVKRLSGPVQKSLSGKVNELVIFFHGYGADGDDLISLSSHFSSSLPNAEFHAPNAPDKCDMGGLGYQWFPINQNNDGTISINATNEIMASVKIINEWIDLLSSEKNVKPSSVLLVGFSQGTMMILEALIARQERLLGLIGFSGGFLGVSNEGDLSECKRTPILLVHGDSDPVVPVNMTTTAVERLGQKGFHVEKHICNGLAHGISPDGISRAIEFLKRNIF